MKKKIFLIGNFGFRSNSLNGQTVRTRTIYETFKKYMKSDNTQVRYVDTSIKGGLITKPITCLKAIRDYTNANSVVLLPAQKAIKFLVPIIFYLNHFFRKKIHFVAIGGWLEEFFIGNTKYIKYFKDFAFVYVQTVSLKEKLESLGLTNVVHLPNYRLYNQQIQKIHRVEQIRKIVFFSRVTPKKGVNLAVEAIEKINKLYRYNLKLDIIGPLDDFYRDEFELMMENNENTNYLGVLDPNDILDAISKYDLLIFPTFYEGEGFPGTILDSMTAGVPIVASDWKYNSELLCDGYTGLLFETKNLDDLMNKIVYLVNNLEELNDMKKNCIKESKKYSANNVANILIDNFN